MLEGWRRRVRELKREVEALAIALRDPRTPWTARLFVVLVVAYALSPIDLIPDFIPVLGMLDELLLLPLVLWIALRLIPADVLAEARTRATGRRLASSRAAAVVVVLVWLAVAGASAWWIWGLVHPPNPRP